MPSSQRGRQRERLERRARLHPGLGRLVETARASAPPYIATTAPVPGSHRRQADVHALRAFSSGRSWRTARTAARCERLSNVVVTRRPPRSISWSVKPFAFSSRADRVHAGSSRCRPWACLRRRRASAPAGRRARRASSQPLADHAVEHVVEPGLEPLGVRRRVVAGRRPDDRGEHRALGDRELADVLAEVGLRRRLDAVGAATEVDGVEVVLRGSCPCRRGGRA